MSLARNLSKKLAPLGAAWQRLRRPSWGALVSVVCGLLYLFFYKQQRASLMPGNSDPHYIWLYARSLVFDGDFDFTNDYALCGDPFNQRAYAVTPHPPNPYYIGPAIFYVPALLAARVLVPISAGATAQVRAACSGDLVSSSMLVSPLLGALTLYLSYRIARRWVDDGPAAVAAALFGLASLLTAYSAYQPGYSHVFATFSIALLVWLSVRAWERPESIARWALVGLGLGIAVMQRPPQLIYGLIPAALAWIALCGVRRVAMLALVAVGGALGVVPLLMLYRYMYGSYFGSPIGSDYLHLGHAQPFLLLFAPHGGLFYTTPVAWLAVIGLWPALRQRELARVVVPFMIAGAIEGYLYASGLDWHGTGTFGARRLTTLTPLFVLLTAALLARISELVRERPALANAALSVLFVAPFAFLTFGMMLGYSKYTIPCCQGASQADLYGEGNKQLWALFDRNVGDVAVLPGSAAFAWWYDIPVTRFRDATQSKFYVRDFRARRFVRDRLTLTDPVAVTDGFERASDAARMVEPSARVVFSPEWPFATHVVVTAASNAPATLRVGRQLSFGRERWYGEVTLAGNGRFADTKLAIPKGGFESGPLEVVFETSEPKATDIRVKDLRFIDEAAPR